MLQTNPELYKVAGEQNNHIWLEVLEGQDQGIRVSVPIHSRDYSPTTQKEVLDIEINNVYELTLVSPQESPPEWRIKNIHCERNTRI